MTSPNWEAQPHSGTPSFDTKDIRQAIGGGISEIRIDYGQGYRVYFVQRGVIVVILLCGGDKSTQKLDIATARSLADQLED